MPFLKWARITFCIDSTPPEELLAINGSWEEKSSFLHECEPGWLSCSCGQSYTHMHVSKHQLDLIKISIKRTVSMWGDIRGVGMGHEGWV